jgi:hypothetical protein
MKFDQGIWYSFSISGITNIPDKGDYFIILHESGRKMLFKTNYYVKYNFSIGQTIQCRVDKVNCTGEVFLEPKHPFYNEGQVYEFELVKLLSEDKSIYNATVNDIFGNRIDVFINKTSELQGLHSLYLKVDRVKKGIPILSDPQNQYFKSKESRNEIKLLVKAIENYNSEDFYILSDGGIYAKIKVKHYQKYGFKVGDTIMCEIIGRETYNQLIVEPLNPWYKTGNIYDFKKVSTEDFIDLGGKMAKVAVVLDHIGNKCGVPITDKIAIQLINRDTLNCRVVGFRKGRPKLEINL